MNEGILNNNTAVYIRSEINFTQHSHIPTRHNPRVNPRKLRITRPVQSGTAYRLTKTLHLFSCFSF